MKKLLTIAAALAMTSASAQGSVTGAGASFPFPLYSKMFAEYKGDTGVTV
ncbi:phosphate ABC transporter substrate-binding protein PstS, partial [Deinococcus sp. ME38]